MTDIDRYHYMLLAAFRLERGYYLFSKMTRRRRDLNYNYKVLKHGGKAEAIIMIYHSIVHGRVTNVKVIDGKAT
jgi:Ser/Thr protein kinase RdoA (MazF antagonist)